MEFILMSIAGTATLLVVQLAEFVGGKRSHELRSTIRSIPRHLARSVETLTATVPVAVARRG
jgi:hypothetical protein